LGHFDDGNPPGSLRKAKVFPAAFGEVFHRDYAKKCFFLPVAGVEDPDFHQVAVGSFGQDFAKPFASVSQWALGDLGRQETSQDGIGGDLASFMGIHAALELVKGDKDFPGVPDRKQGWEVFRTAHVNGGLRWFPRW
jgi:hypothetical protein